MIYRCLKKFKNVICLLLIVFFTINIAGCGSDNGVSFDKVNNKVGIGNDNAGYTVYAQSTFDKMSEELLMGYLLSGRDFTLLVLPGKGDGSDDNPYVLRDDNNILYQSTLAGIFKYDEDSASFVDPEKKLLIYYVTDVELRSWFVNFASNDNFMANAMDFVESGYDLEKPSRFKCEQLVNMGTGMNAKSFCGTFSSGAYSGGIINNSNGDFNDNITGGMFLLFGYGSIEGYITYEHINNYMGSRVADTLTNPEKYYSDSDRYDPSKIKQFNYNSMLEIKVGSQSLKDILLTEDYGYVDDDFASFNSNNDLITDLIGLYSEILINAAAPGYQKLKKTYELIGSALLSDNGAATLGDLKTTVNQKIKEAEDAKPVVPDIENLITYLKEFDKWNAILSIIEMVDDKASFDEAAKKEAFSIKLSVALYNRYHTVIDYPGIEDMVTRYVNSSITPVNDLSKAESLVNGIDESGPTNNSYLLLVTADGFTIDRGTKEDQRILGYSDMLGMGTLLAELVRMDGCPNATLAAKMYNMVANLKIYAGLALTAAGVSAIGVAGVGLAVASVIAKLAGISSVAPVPGARIAALVLIAVAGIVTLATGLITFLSGTSDKARLEGLGASDTNYCKTYASTFNLLFETIQMAIPVYHYNIERSSSADSNLSLNICLGLSNEYDSSTGKCTNGDDATNVPLYYYANLNKVEKLKLEGCPMLMYFQNGQLVDYIYGAATPSFIVEILRVWGLLAMREVVYNAQYDESSGYINVFHTTNNNSRTHTIKSANYCFTTEYLKDLTGEIKDNDICYDYYGNHGYANVGLNRGYIFQSGIERNYAILSVYGPKSGSGVDSKLKSLSYNSYYAGAASYLFNSYKNVKGVTMVDPANNSISYEIAEGKAIYLKTLNSDGTGEVYVDINGNVYSNKEEAPKYDYLQFKGKLNSYFVIDGMILKSDSILEKLTGSLTKVATFNGNRIDLNNDFYQHTSLVKKPDGSVYSVNDFLDYITGNLTFERKEVVVPIYFTATVAESQQATSGGGKTCDEGEYLYYKKDKYKDNYKCLRDDKVKSKHTPYSTTDFDASDLKYYNTSLQIGSIILTLDEKGEVTKTINWN